MRGRLRRSVGCSAGGARRAGYPFYQVTAKLLEVIEAASLDELCQQLLPSTLPGASRSRGRGHKCGSILACGSRGRHPDALDAAASRDTRILRWWSR
jgi:hypothetical protein